MPSCSSVSKVGMHFLSACDCPRPSLFRTCIFSCDSKNYSPIVWWQKSRKYGHAIFMGVAWAWGQRWMSPVRYVNFVGTETCAKSRDFQKTRKPSYRWQTRATRKHAENCSNSTCLQRCRWQYWSIFIRLAAVVASEICEMPRNSLKIQTYRVQGQSRSAILVSI